MSAPSDGQALDQKKAELSGDALRRLDATAERVDRLDAYVGGPQKLGAATGDVLVEAVERAETERHRELSKALSPLVVATYDQLARYPLRLEIDHDSGRVVLRGLAANEEEPQAVVDAIAPAAAPYKVERGVAVVALATETAHLKAAETRAREILKEARAEIDALRAELKDARAISKADARDKLRRLTESFAVFLSERDNIIDPSASEAKLDELAELLKVTGSDLRVVGYAHKAGSAGSNRALSRKRADMIVAKLVERGVPRARLAPVGRATLDPIADADLEKSRSRRVVFEIPFDGEFDVK